jgi:hypothetical protein
MVRQKNENAFGVDEPAAVAHQQAASFQRAEEQLVQVDGDNRAADRFG